MEGLLIGVAALACPIGMGSMMWFMVKGMRGGSAAKDAGPADVETLRAEHQRLGEEIERLERGRAREFDEVTQ
jgi:hypothetical protein